MIHKVYSIIILWEKKTKTYIILEHTWDDWSEEEEEQQVQCLYCKDILPSAKEVLQHMKLAHTFDFQNTRKTLQLDFYQCIRLINYVRYKVSFTFY